MSQPQRFPAPVLPRQAPYGQRPYGQPTLPGPRPAQGTRPQAGVGPVGPRSLAPRPAPANPNAAGPAIQRPAARAAVTFLTVAEVAGMMRVSKMTVYRLVHAGDMSAVRVGRSFRVPESAVRNYLTEGRTDVA